MDGSHDRTLDPTSQQGVAVPWYLPSLPPQHGCSTTSIWTRTNIQTNKHPNEQTSKHKPVGPVGSFINSLVWDWPPTLPIHPYPSIHPFTATDILLSPWKCHLFQWSANGCRTPCKRRAWRFDRGKNVSIKGTELDWLIYIDQCEIGSCSWKIHLFRQHETEGEGTTLSARPSKVTVVSITGIYFSHNFPMSHFQWARQFVVKTQLTEAMAPFTTTIFGMPGIRTARWSSAESSSNISVSCRK